MIQEQTTWQTYKEILLFLAPYVILSVIGYDVRTLNNRQKKFVLRQFLMGTVTAAFSGIIIGLFVYQAKPAAFPGWAAAGIAGWYGGNIIDRLTDKIFGTYYGGDNGDNNGSSSSEEIPEDLKDEMK